MPDDVSPPAPPRLDPAAAETPPVSAADADRTVAPARDRTGVFPVVPASAVVVPGFQVVREISRGGMGVVYEVRQLGLDRVVALKMVLGEGRADDHVVRQFLTEAAAVAAVVHDNVVQVHQCGEHLGRPFLALEYCPGGTLAEYLRGVRLAPRAAAELVLKVARGVAAAHAAGIVHRDIKPGNVLLDAHGNPKVADFGLAKVAAAADQTRGGGVTGTPAYMAPEQASGAGGVGRPADVWALGVILYECLTRARPFDGGSTVEIMAAVRHRDPVPPRGRVARIPRDLEFILLKCLRKDARDRYPTAAELVADLGRFLAGEPLGGRRREWGYRARKALAGAGRPAVLVGCLVLALAGVWRATRPPPLPPATVDPSFSLRREEVVRRVEALARARPNPDRESPHPVTAQPDLPPADLTAFRVVYDDRVVDLRGWRQLPPEDPTGESFVVFNSRRVMMKVVPADTYPVEFRTTGRGLILRAVTPNPDRATVVAADRPGHAGARALKVRQLVMDVSTVPVGTEFTAHSVATFRGSLQTPDEQWFGAIGYDGSLKSSMLLVFPDDRPFRDYTLRVAAIRQADPVPYTGPVITFEADDRRWLYWEIPSPRDGYVYRIDWNW